jgi:alpha-L-arabinofuranosidase
MKIKLIHFLIATVVFSFNVICINSKVIHHVQTVKIKNNTVDSVFIFTYSPDSREGLHLAESIDGKTWKEVGRILSCDYGPWGVEKRMFSPYLLKESENSWKAVWQVNDYAPCFAIASTKDLILWKPQDYPHMNVSGCLSPVLSNGTSSYIVKFKSKNSRIYSTASLDFMHFSDAKLDVSNDYNQNMSMANINGKEYQGQKWRVSSVFINKVKNFFVRKDNQNKQNSERLSDDRDRFSSILKQNIDGNHPLAVSLMIDSQKSKKISDKLIGIFFEDISYAADGGLYAEMVQNRDFEYSSGENHHDKLWNAAYAWTSSCGITIDTVMPISKNNPHYAVLEGNSITNSGWDGFSLVKDSQYNFSMYARCISCRAMSFRISLVAGDHVIDSKVVEVKGKQWNKVTTTFISTSQVDKAVLMVEPLRKPRVAVDMISLFPKNTFKGHVNGLRADLAQVIVDMHPKFMRFPGGCMSHGDGLSNIYHWKESVGALQDRVPARNIWNYHQTRGLGFYEYFQFCEDIGCEPLPVLAAGVPCQNSASDNSGFSGQQGGIPMKDMPQYIQDLLDLIEWANGDPALSKWAKLRADAGHPAPFHLHYIGIGNEDLISTVFKERYLMICQAIKEKYPDITICGTVGPFYKGSSDYEEGWKIAKENKNIINMVDEHYYESTGWFMHNQDYYDTYDRTAPKVYLGEYAASTSAKRSNVETALAEALHLCNVERNGDVVNMTSYAPLLAKDGYNNWNPDMIYFNNCQVRTTPSYETQRLFSKYSGDEYVSTKVVADSSYAYRIAASVVRDSKSGRAYLKIVNMMPVSVSVNVDLSSLRMSPFLTDGFYGNPSDINITPYAEQIVTNGTIATLVMKPYSFQTILMK